MYYHIRANGQLVNTERRLVENSIVLDWWDTRDTHLVVLNCLDTETANNCYELFMASVARRQLAAILRTPELNQ